MVFVCFRTKNIVHLERHLYRTTPNSKMFEFRQVLHKMTFLKSFCPDFSLSKKQKLKQKVQNREKTPSSHWPEKEFPLVYPTTEKEVQNGENNVASSCV
jgi:hypothetical protein